MSRLPGPGAFAALALLAARALAADATPPVEKVVLYVDGAMVTRSADADCVDGSAVARFPALPPSLDPATVRATASGAATQVEGVSLDDRLQENPYAEEVAVIDRKLEEWRAKVQDYERRIERARASRERASSLRQSAVPFIAREAASQAKPNTQAWGAALDVARGAIEEADAQRRAAEIAQRDAYEEIEKLERRRDQLAGAAPERAFDAEVVLRCRPGRARVELSYIAPGARWAPAYEARSDEAGGTVALSVLAQVTQATGETWKDVDVTLSTASARRDARPPKPTRLYVSATPEEEKKKVLVRREEAAAHVDAPGAPAAPGGGEVAAAEQGLSVQLKVPGRATLEGDGRPARLLVETVKLPAKFGLLAIPKAVPLVFRSAEAKNVAKYPLLAGPVDLFSGPSFLGTTQLPRTGEGDQVRLAFGAEEKVKVRRVVLSEEKKDPGFLGSTRRLVYSYRVELESYAGKPIEVRVQEHVPVSELDDVKVTITEKTTKPFELVQSDGLVTWKVPLKDGEKKNLELHFTVELPEKYESGGL